jgi:hypothetical protein
MKKITGFIFITILCLFITGIHFADDCAPRMRRRRSLDYVID